MGQELRVGSAESANGYSMNLQREGAVEFSSQTKPYLKPGHFVISLLASTDVLLLHQSLILFTTMLSKRSRRTYH